MKPVLIKGGISDQPAVMKTDEIGRIQLRLLDRVTARNTHKISDLKEDDFLTKWRTPQELGINKEDIKDNTSTLPQNCLETG